MSDMRLPQNSSIDIGRKQPELASLIAASAERLRRLGSSARSTKRLERLMIAARTLGAERRMGPRMPFAVRTELVLGAGRYQTTSIDIGRRGIMLASPSAPLKLDDINAVIELPDLGRFAARVVALDAHCISLTFVECHGNPARDGLIRLISSLERENASAISLSERFAREIGAAFEHAVEIHRISLDTLFSSELRRIPDTDPVQYDHPAMAFFEAVLPAIMARYFRPGANMAYAVATSRNCFVPVHHTSLSQTQRPVDLTFNHAFSRHRRIYDDRWTLRAAALSPHPVVQAYQRDVPQGFGALVRDVSAPIHVRNRHWGAAQIAYVLDEDEADGLRANI